MLKGGYPDEGCPYIELFCCFSNLTARVRAKSYDMRSFGHGECSSLKTVTKLDHSGSNPKEEDAVVSTSRSTILSTAEQIVIQYIGEVVEQACWLDCY